MRVGPFSWPVCWWPGSTWQRKAAVSRRARRRRAGGRERQGEVLEGVPVTGSGLLVGALALSALGDHLGARLPLGAWALGPLSLHPFALAYLAVGMAMISKRLRVPKP
jgi:hypothetical protein